MDELKSRQEKPDVDMKKEEGGSPKRKKPNHSFDEFLQLYGKYIILALAAILVVVTVIIVVGKLKKDGGETKTESSQAVTQSPETPAPELPGGSLEKDTNQAVNDLVNAYFTAVQNCDVEALSALVDSADSISAEQLQAEREYPAIR